MCLTISVSVAQWHLLNNLTKFQIHIKVTVLPCRNIWLWGTHPQEYMMSCQGQISPPYPKAMVEHTDAIWLLKEHKKAWERDMGTERKDTGITGAWGLSQLLSALPVYVAVRRVEGNSRVRARQKWASSPHEMNKVRGMDGASSSLKHISTYKLSVAQKTIKIKREDKV